MEKLKVMFGSGINALDDLAGKLDGNSQLTFERLNSEVSKHSSALGEVCISCKLLSVWHIFSVNLVSYLLLKW